MLSPVRGWRKVSRRAWRHWPASSGKRLAHPAVHRVPQHRVAQGGHVDPDLVGAAGLQPALEVGVPGVPGQDGPVGHRGPAAEVVHRHLLPVGGVAGDGERRSCPGPPGDCPPPPPRTPGRGCDPGAAAARARWAMSFLAAMMRPLVSRSIRWTIPGPELAVDAGEALAAVVEQGVDQGAVGVARGGVDHQPHGLVHHDDVPVLVHHVQGDFLGQDLHRGGVGDAEGEHVPGLEAVVLLHGPCPPAGPGPPPAASGRRSG